MVIPKGEGEGDEGNRGAFRGFMPLNLGHPSQAESQPRIPCRL